MFLGTFEHNLLEKGRISLPKKIRREISGDKVILTVGFENCIVGFAEKDWTDNTREVVSKSFFSDREFRDLRRKIFAEAESVEFDDQGRFVIPKSLVLRVGIKSSVTIIGAGDHFEIWETTIWEEYKKKLES